MNTQIIDKIIESFIEFSLTEREALYKILIILIFLLFLVRKNNGEIVTSNLRKTQINKALETLCKKVNYRGEYKIPKEIEKKLYQNNFNKASILMLVASIMKHLGYPNTIPGLTINKVSNDEDVKPGFCNTYPGGQSNITINILPEYDLEVIAAIIIHECMHHYLNIKRIKFEDRIENEILTDTCAIYCGFGKYMYEGYKTRARQYKFENKLHKVGYLTQNEIRYIMRKL